MAINEANSEQHSILTATQTVILTKLNRQFQIHTQKESNPLSPCQEISSSITKSIQTPNTSEIEISLRDFIERRNVTERIEKECKEPEFDKVQRISTQFDKLIFKKWENSFKFSQETFQYVQEMEKCHQQIVSKTSAQLDIFATNLKQTEALETQIQFMQKSLSKFSQISQLARILGFVAEFPGANLSAECPVRLIRRRTDTDPTTKEFHSALEAIEESLEFLAQHLDFKDTNAYMEAYQTLLAGGIAIIKDFALTKLDKARDSVASIPSQVLVDETSSHYVQFQLIAPALQTVAKQILHIYSILPHRSSESEKWIQHLNSLLQVGAIYAQQRAFLLCPIFSSHLNTASHSTDIVHLLRICANFLVQLTEAEHNLFTSLFSCDPTYIFRTSRDAIKKSEEGQDAGNAFEGLIIQFSNILYNLMRPRILEQCDLDTLCEVIEILQTEIHETMLASRHKISPYIEPVLDRLIEDAQERLTFCVQKYLCDEIEGFTPTPQDLNYPERLTETRDVSMYAVWYPSLERTLLCLSKMYHFLNVEIFRELAQDAIQECTISLKKASAEISTTQSSLHGELFLIKHLLILREQITPFEITFATTSKALDFTTTADAMTHLLADVSTMFVDGNNLSGFISRAMTNWPQVQETTFDVKEFIEMELKTSCTIFIDSVLKRLAKPLLKLCSRYANSKEKLNATSASPNVLEKMAEEIIRQLDEEMPIIVNNLHIYLNNSSTEAILLKAVQRNLLDAILNLRNLMRKSYSLEEIAFCESLIERLVKSLQSSRD